MKNNAAQAHTACTSGLSAHTYLGRHMLKLDDAEVAQTEIDFPVVEPRRVAEPMQPTF